MMARSLLILRHAKSSWVTAAEADFDRPLNARGKRDAKRLGCWMAKEVERPELILASPACRVKQTLKRIRNKTGWPKDLVQWDKALYLAGLNTLSAALEDALCVHKRIMLVGHNPGLEELLKLICGEDLPYTAGGKLLTTGNLAEIEFQDPTITLSAGCGRLLRLIRPDELPEA